MHPILFEYGPIKIHSFGAMLLVAFLAAMQVARRRAVKFNLPAAGVTDLLFWTLIAGVLGARIGYLVQEIPYYSAHPEKLLTLQFQGLTSFGGVVLGAATAILFARKQKWSVPVVLDVIGPAFLVGHIIGRIGCLLNGCCYGQQCNLPWAIHIHDLLGRYHPAQVYDSLMNLVAVGIILGLERKFRFKPGQVFGLVLVFHGITRMIYEIWRAGATGKLIGGTPFTEAQLAALILCAIGAVSFAAFGRKAVTPVEQAS